MLSLYLMMSRSVARVVEADEKYVSRISRPWRFREKISAWENVLSRKWSSVTL